MDKNQIVSKKINVNLAQIHKFTQHKQRFIKINGGMFYKWVKPEM